MARLQTTMLTALITLFLSTAALSGDKASQRGTAELRYRLVEIYRTLPDGGREELAAIALNDRGEVVAAGSLRVVDEDPFIDGYPGPRNFIWRNGRVITELVSPDPVLFDVESHDINNRGEVVGSLARYDPGYGTRGAFIWRNGRFTSLQDLPSAYGYYQFATALSVNHWGEVAGYTVDDDNSLFVTAFRWYRGRSSRVPVDPALSASAVGINNWGVVVGNSRPQLNAPYPGRYGGFVADRKGRVRYLESLPGSERMTAEAINDRGQIIGSANGRAVLWEDGSVLDLGTLPGASSTDVTAINVFGTIVGFALYASGDPSAVIWKDGQLRNLNELISDDDPVGANVHLTGASDINNLGWITARGIDASDPEGQQAHAYLLVPVRNKRR